MQVNHRTRRWPFVVGLAGLLLFCLSVPRYWRGDEAPEGVNVKERPRSSAAVQRRSRPRDAMLDLDDLMAAAAAEEAAQVAAPAKPIGAPKISMADDEILAQLSLGSTPSLPQPNFSNVSWPTPDYDFQIGGIDVPNTPLAAADTFAAVDNVEFPVSAVDNAEVEAQVSSVFESVGQALVDYAPESVVARAVRRTLASLRTDANWPVVTDDSTETNPIWSGPATQPSDLSTPTFPVEPLPNEPTTVGVTPPLASSLWSVPEVLVSQLEELQQYSFARAWANETLSQLRSLVEGEYRDGAHTAALIEGLSNSAAAAIKLAEQVDDDEPLRVELLRAHWGLQRRLDCWTAMRDIRVAAISEKRIATRGPLGPLYNDAGDPASRHLESLSAELESYEQSRDPELGRRIAQAERQLRTSSDDLDHALADAVENNYRNANVRVAVTAEMLNRFAARENAEARPVHERIAGTPVRGQSETTSRTRVVLQPAVGVWQMALVTEGVVESDTSSVGRAKVHTHGSTQFVAQTPIVVDSQGNIHKQPTAVSAESCNQLLGVTTGLDWIPVVNCVVRQEVVNQYNQKRPQAKAEVEYKVETRTSERVDARTDEAVADMRQRFQDRLANPLSKYGVDVTALEMTTTTERIVARLRVAGNEQLAGHTPRPRALSDSLTSLQVHESALTNAAVALQLNGERLTASQLQARLREKLPRLAMEQPPEARDDTIFQFASKDAVQFHISEGKFELALSITEFVQEEQRVRNFVVHAYYKPVINGLTAELVRDGVLGIEGTQGRIGATDRALLHNVFQVVLSEDRRLPIFKPQDPNDARLRGLMITQLVLEDGWLGVSIGPATGGRVAERQRSLR